MPVIDTTCFQMSCARVLDLFSRSALIGYYSKSRRGGFGVMDVAGRVVEGGLPSLQNFDQYFNVHNGHS